MSRWWLQIGVLIIVSVVSFSLGQSRGIDRAPEIADAMLAQNERLAQWDREYREAQEAEPGICEHIIDLVLEYENESELLLQGALDELSDGRD
ncbi:MAG: hypothetical protein AAF346_04885 [Pseudomonadota bacterium]